jgi:threonine dehydratase
MVDLQDIKAAATRIADHIHQTPVLSSRLVNRKTRAEVFFKCENFQRAGAFKFRGACNALFAKPDNEIKDGVVTHSSGNFAQALALAASLRGIQSHIVMPETAPLVKVNAVRDYGGKITFCKPTLAAREQAADLIIQKTGALFIHPFDDDLIIAGQGTAALELISEVPELDVIMAPIGGGGLMGGTAVAARHLMPSIEIIAAEPINANDAKRSFQDKILYPSINPNTIADGLLTSVGALNFEIMLCYFDDVMCCSEVAIINAMHFIWERMKIVVEPSAAVPLAVLMEHPERFVNKRIGVILSGGNVDLNKQWF